MKTNRKPFILLIALVLALSACKSAPTPTPVPVTAGLSEIQGTVGIKNPGDADFAAASADDTLQVEGQVQTGADGRVRLDLSTGTILRVAPDSLFTLISNVPQEDGSLVTKIKLLTGKIWITLKGGSMDVDSPSGVASVRGSYMMVWVDPDTSDVWVSCLEGWCNAGNSSASLDLVASEGTVLYHFDPQSSTPPPPPALRYLSQQDINDFVSNNPEAQTVMNAVIATASALPTLTATPTYTPVEPTSTDTPVPTDTETPTLTPTLTNTPRPWPTWTPTVPTATFVLPTHTPTGTGTYYGANISLVQGPNNGDTLTAAPITIEAYINDPSAGIAWVSLKYDVYDPYGNLFSQATLEEPMSLNQKGNWQVDTVFGYPPYGFTVKWTIEEMNYMDTPTFFYGGSVLINYFGA